MIVKYSVPHQSRLQNTSLFCLFAFIICCGMLPRKSSDDTAVIATHSDPTIAFLNLQNHLTSI
jgi:hypothetical protein